MRGVYTAQVSISALAAAKTLMYVTAPADKVVEILSAEVSNKSNETNEQLECTFQRVTTLGTPTATTLTPSKHENGDQAAGSTVKGDVTASEPTYGTNTEIGRAGFASLAGWRFDPVPEERPIIPGQGTLGLRMLSTPTAFDAVVRITFREVG
jgi:hypothetical protein